MYVCIYNASKYVDLAEPKIEINYVAESIWLTSESVICLAFIIKVQ
jgi:hypothetical protein